MQGSGVRRLRVHGLTQVRAICVVFFGDTVVPNLEEDHTFPFGVVFCRNIVLLFATTQPPKQDCSAGSFSEKGVA